MPRAVPGWCVLVTARTARIAGALPGRPLLGRRQIVQTVLQKLWLFGALTDRMHSPRACRAEGPGASNLRLGVSVVYNRIILIGRLTREPELRFTADGHAVATFTLAVDRPFKNGQGEREADFIDVTVWRKPAESTAEYVHKGHLIAVEGRLDIRSYTDRQGIRRKGARVVASGVRFLTPKSGNGVGDGRQGNAGEGTERSEPDPGTVTPAADAEADAPF